LLSQLDDASISDGAKSVLVLGSKDSIRRHLVENQTILRDYQDRIRRNQDDLELQDQRRQEMERLLVEKDANYESLLGKFNHSLDAVQIAHNSLAQHNARQMPLVLMLSKPLK
jgi:hypothetical protein